MARPTRPARLAGLCALATLPLATLPLAVSAAHAATPPGTVTAVLIGANDPNGILPTFDKVPNAGTDNLDVALPLSVLTRGQGYVVMIMSQVATFSGTCQSSYEITQTVGSTTTVLNKGSVKPYTCSSGQIFGYAIGTKKIAGVAGPATLSGTVSFGGVKVKLKVPLVLQ